MNKEPETQPPQAPAPDAARSIPDTLSNAEAAYELAIMARRLARRGLIGPDEIQAMRRGAHFCLGRYFKRAKDEAKRAIRGDEEAQS